MNLIPIQVPMRVASSKTLIPMSVASNEATISMQISAAYIVGSADYYDGAYDVTPRLYAQSLDTDGKVMEDDVTVYEIPVTRTTNPTGGLTVLIG